MSQHRKTSRLDQAEGCGACSRAAGPRLAGSNLAGLARAAVPLVLTKALERWAGGCWGLSHAPVFLVIISTSIACTSYWETLQRDDGHGLNSQLLLL